jgi:hypothetical protein
MKYHSILFLVTLRRRFSVGKCSMKYHSSLTVKVLILGLENAGLELPYIEEKMLPRCLLKRKRQLQFNIHNPTTCSQ